MPEKSSYGQGMFSYSLNFPLPSPPPPPYFGSSLRRSPTFRPKERPATQVLTKWSWYKVTVSAFLFSTFADRFLNNLSNELLDQYDTLINEPTNDWDIYYWMTGAKETPKVYENQVMELLKKHARNENMESRIRQPDLKF